MKQDCSKPEATNRREQRGTVRVYDDASIFVTVEHYSLETSVVEVSDPDAVAAIMVSPTQLMFDMRPNILRPQPHEVTWVLREDVSGIYRSTDRVDAVRWFKNGDHPEDGPPETEGKVVRYYRHPGVKGTSGCKLCGNPMHNHGWIDTPPNGVKVCPGDWLLMQRGGEGIRVLDPDSFRKMFAYDIHTEHRNEIRSLRRKLADQNDKLRALVTGWRNWEGTYSADSQVQWLESGTKEALNDAADSVERVIGHAR